MGTTARKRLELEKNTEIRKANNKNTIKRALRKDFQLYLMLLLPLLFFIIFRYIPMGGLIIAFRRFVPGGSMFGATWEGLHFFRLFWESPVFWNVFRNTITISVVNIIVGFPLPIIFALLLNEIRHSPLKRFVQTVSFLPRFFSMVVIVSLIHLIVSPSSGILNLLIEFLGGEAIHFLIRAEYFIPIYVISEQWQWMGWNAIIYIAAITAVDTQLYEAAAIDGASRWKQTWHVTLPSIMPTIMILGILTVGHILNVGFEKVLLLYSPAIYHRADVIQTFVYRMGIIGNQQSFATAIGLFNSVITIVLIFIANYTAKRATGHSLW